MFESREPLFYHAANVALESNYRLLDKEYQKHKNWEAVWKAIKSDSQKQSTPEALWDNLGRLGVRLILREDAEFPPLLKEIPWPPLGLYIRGNPEVLKTQAVAIVGTRKATSSGRTLAREFAEALSRAGLVIVSGLAFGIDAAAHEGCLQAGGKAIAVLGSGLERFTPRSNERLAQSIIGAGGAVVSEYPPGHRVRLQNFLERNRIVSGLSRGVLLIEIPEGSGALATARFALDQNREVFVVPGPLNHPNFAGSHNLIRQGAELVTEPQQILEALRPGILEFSPKTSQKPKLSNPEEELIFAAIKNAAEPLDIDKLVELTKLTAQDVSRAVSFLLIKNVVREDSQGYTL